MDAIGLISTAFIGLVLGSFATMLSYRLPLEGSVLSPRRSQCVSCRKSLGMSDLIPLFSWIFLGGKCRHCRARIGWRYPLIELATVALCLLFFSVYGLRLETFLIFLTAPVLVSIIDIDLHHKIIPDSLNLALLGIAAALLLLNASVHSGTLNFILDRGGAALAGFFIYGLGSLLLRQAVMMVMKREPMGLGDVKLYAVAGFWLGLNPDAASVFLLVSGFAGLGLTLLWKKCTGEVEAPFGPALVIAFIAALYFCPPGFL